MSAVTIKVSLPEICELVTDGTHDSPKLQPSGVPFIKGKHISSGRIDFEACDFITEQDHLKCIQRVKPRTNDVLFSNIGSVGDVARVSDNIEFSIKNVALASKTVREGSKMPRADWKFLLKLEFNCPSKAVLDLFNDSMKPICAQLKNLALHNQQLIRARDLLLPRLINEKAVMREE